MRVSRLSRLIARIALVALLVALAGCSLFHRGKKGDPMDTLPVEQLYQQGVDALEAGNYDFASRSFERLIARFPFGPYTEQSQINLAYAQYKDGKPDDAYSTVNRFIKTYPTHQHIDYAYYLRGLINFNRGGGLLERYVGQDMTKRDQANLRQSFDDFAALIDRYPNSALRRRCAPAHGVPAQRDGAVGTAHRGVLPAPQRVRRGSKPRQGDRRDLSAVAASGRCARDHGRELQEARPGQARRRCRARAQAQLSGPSVLAGDWPEYRSWYWKLVPLSNRG